MKKTNSQKLIVYTASTSTSLSLSLNILLRGMLGIELIRLLSMMHMIYGKASISMKN